MKNFVVRALSIGMLSEDQIHSLHKLENKKLYLIPPYNLRPLFGISSIKEFYGLPQDPEELANYGEKIKALIESKVVSLGELISVENGDIEMTHEFDWGLFKRRNELPLAYENSAQMMGKPGRLRKILEAKLEIQN